MQEISSLFVYFFSSFCFSVCIFSLFLWLQFYTSGFFRRTRKERGREESFQSIFFRFGGALAFLIFFFSIIGNSHLVFTPDIFGLFLGAVAIFVLGTWDDVKPIFWKWQLYWQCVIVFFTVFLANIQIASIPSLFGEGRIFFVNEWEFLGYAFAFFWFLLVMNSLNWIDGVDGLAPGIIVLSGISIAAVSLRPEVFQPPIFLLAGILCAIFFGLWLFNIHPAKIISGTTGVFVSGFILAYLSLYAGAKLATLFLVLALPILDVFRVIFWRIILWKPCAMPDKNHIHHTLLMKGWNTKYVVFFLLCVVALSSFVTLILETRGKILALFFLGILFFGGILYEYRERTKNKTPVS